MMHRIEETKHIVDKMSYDQCPKYHTTTVTESETTRWHQRVVWFGNWNHCEKQHGMWLWAKWQFGVADLQLERQTDFCNSARASSFKLQASRIDSPKHLFFFSWIIIYFMKIIIFKFIKSIIINNKILVK